LKWNEDDIIKGCLSDDKKSQEMLYRKYAATLFGLCLRYCRTRAEAEDVLQEGFVKIFSNLKNYKYQGSFEGWLKRIVINTALNSYRDNLKKGFMQNIDNIYDSDIHSQANENVFGKYAVDDLMKLIQELPDGYRAVFNLYAIEGFNHKEIADMLDITESTSKSQLSRARKYLQNKLAETSINSKIAI